MKKFTNLLKVAFGFLLYAIYSVQSIMACSTCTSQYTEEKIQAYSIATIILTLLPSSVGLSIYLYYKKRVKQLKAESENDSLK